MLRMRFSIYLKKEFQQCYSNLRLQVYGKLIKLSK